VHAIGGTLGTILTGVFATAVANPSLATGPVAGLLGRTLWLEQLKAGAIVVAWSVGATMAIAWLVKHSTSGLRVNHDNERVGLDLTEHGEEGYIID
jgi:Amt family ammonium transporter